jgi:hypothetical protein
VLIHGPAEGYRRSPLVLDQGTSPLRGNSMWHLLAHTGNTFSSFASTPILRTARSSKLIPGAIIGWCPLPGQEACSSNWGNHAKN